MTPTSSQISERRRLVAIGVKADKSLRLIARELDVTATTISRDMKVLGITANKKPTATRRKPAVVFKDSSRATSDSKVASQNPTKPHPPAPRPIISPRRVVPEPLKRRPPKPLSPEQLRRQRLEEMLQLVGSWLLERKPDYLRAINVLDKARNLLATHRDSVVRGAPESPMSAAELRDYTRPPEMGSAKSQSLSRREEVCALWLARWLAAWEPDDKQLRNDVLDQVRAHVCA
jgi:hypothetical protein